MTNAERLGVANSKEFQGVFENKYLIDECSSIYKAPDNHIDMEFYNLLLRNAISEISKQLKIIFITPVPVMSNENFFKMLLCPAGNNDNELRIKFAKKHVSLFISDISSEINKVISAYFYDESYVNTTNIINIDQSLLKYDFNWKLDLGNIKSVEKDFEEKTGIECLSILKSFDGASLSTSESEAIEFVIAELDKLYKSAIQTGINYIANFKFEANNGQNGFAPNQLVQRMQEGIKVHVDGEQPTVQVPVQQQNMNGLATGDEMNKRMNELSEKIIGIMN